MIGNDRSMIDDDSAIAYGVALAITAIIVLGVAWISMAPVIDELHALVIDLNAGNPDIFTDELVTKTEECTDIWKYITFLFVAVPFVYAIVRAIKRQVYDD